MFVRMKTATFAMRARRSPLSSLDVRIEFLIGFPPGTLTRLVFTDSFCRIPSVACFTSQSTTE